MRFLSYRDAIAGEYSQSDREIRILTIHAYKQQNPYISDTGQSLWHQQRPEKSTRKW